MIFQGRHKQMAPAPGEALAGRPERPFPIPSEHYVLGTPLEPPFPEDTEQAIFGLGCFWGAEKAFWQLPGRLQHSRRLRGWADAQPDV